MQVTLLIRTRLASYLMRNTSRGAVRACLLVVSCCENLRIRFLKVWRVRVRLGVPG